MKKGPDTNLNAPYLSIVVAAYNEAALIEENVRRIVSVLEERPEVKWELIIVNDGSIDGTDRNSSRDE